MNIPGMHNDREKIAREKERIEISREFFEKWKVGIGTSVRVKYDEHQFKTTDPGIINDIISSELAHIKFPEKKGGGGTFHMENLVIIT
jgi:hypothetical protein